MVSAKKISVNTGVGKNSFVVDKISGFLEAVIIKSEALVNVIILLNDLDVVLLDKETRKVVEYLPLRMNAVDMKGDKINYSSERVVLDNELKIVLNGPQNSMVEITFLVSE